MIACSAALTACGGGGGATSAADGKELFGSLSCGSCHTLAAAGATGTVGPDLDEVLPGQSRAFIHESIVDPNAETTPGYSAGIMPSFAQLSEPEVESLVDFLAQSTSG